jgi:imidazoleglycerol-phosphate dehydratase
MTRTATVKRQTSETNIEVQIDLDGGPSGKVDSGHGFLDHMLEQMIRHGRFKVKLHGKGDLHVDIHHLAEDAGITLGSCFRKALGEGVGIERFADAWAPMDESLAHVVIDLSGRPFFSFDPDGFEGTAGGFNVHHLREFLRGFTTHAGATVHVRVLTGKETHHVCEAVMKAWARALYSATRTTTSGVPSTKGTIEAP